MIIIYLTISLLLIIIVINIDYICYMLYYRSIKEGDILVSVRKEKNPFIKEDFTAIRILKIKNEYVKYVVVSGKCRDVNSVSIRSLFNESFFNPKDAINYRKDTQKDINELLNSLD